MSTPSKSGSVPIEQLRKQLFKTLLARLDDDEVQKRLDAAIVELRLIEGVGERPVGSARAKDPLVDLLLRLLGIGDDAAKPPKLKEPLTPAQQRAAWVATRVFKDPTAAVESEETLPAWAIPESEREAERVIIGWKPDASALNDIDPQAALAKLRQEMKELDDDPPTDRGASSTSLEPPKPTDGSMVSFGDNESFNEALQSEFYDITERFVLSAEAQDHYQAMTTEGGHPAVDVSGEWLDAEGEDEDAMAVALAAAAAMQSITPAPVRRHADAVPPRSQSDEPPEPSYAANATPQPAPVAQSAATSVPKPEPVVTPAATPRPAPSEAVAPTPPHVDAPGPAGATPIPTGAEPTPEEREETRLTQQSNLGLIVAAGGLFVLLVTGGVGFAAVQGSMVVNAAATRADTSRSGLYNAITTDPGLIQAVGALGADEELLRRRYLSFDGSNSEERTRRALAFASALGSEWRQITPGGSRYLQAQQGVERVIRASRNYEGMIEEWNRSTQTPLGALATTVGLGRLPSPDALVPLE